MHPIRTTFALVLATSAIAAPAASARFAPDPPLPAQTPALTATAVRPNPDEQVLGGPSTLTPTSVVSVRSNPQGFQFDDAAIGAGVMTGLMVLGLGGTLAVRRRGQLRHG